MNTLVESEVLSVAETRPVSASCFIFSLLSPVSSAAADQQIERSGLFLATERRVQFIFLLLPQFFC